MQGKRPPQKAGDCRCFLIDQESSGIKAAVTGYKRFINAYEAKNRSELGNGVC
jgi:hypothetical protein